MIYLRDALHFKCFDLISLKSSRFPWLGRGTTKSEKRGRKLRRNKGDRVIRKKNSRLFRENKIVKAVESWLIRHRCFKLWTVSYFIHTVFIQHFMHSMYAHRWAVRNILEKNFVHHCTIVITLIESEAWSKLQDIWWQVGFLGILVYKSQKKKKKKQSI